MKQVESRHVAKFQMQIDTAHGVLFLADSAPVVSIPPDIGTAFATATTDCVAFCVLHYVDGASLVTVTEEACESDDALLFDGAIEASTGVVTLMDSSAFRYLNIPVPEGQITVRIWAEDNRNPEWVWIQLGAVRPI
jgi:hypothetical protein